MHDRTHGAGLNQRPDVALDLASNLPFSATGLLRNVDPVIVKRRWSTAITLIVARAPPRTPICTSRPSMPNTSRFRLTARHRPRLARRRHRGLPSVPL